MYLFLAGCEKIESTDNYKAKVACIVDVIDVIDEYKQNCLYPYDIPAVVSGLDPKIKRHADIITAITYDLSNVTFRIIDNGKQYKEVDISSITIPENLDPFAGKIDAAEVDYKVPPSLTRSNTTVFFKEL